MATIIDLFPTATDANNAIRNAASKPIPAQLVIPQASGSVVTDRTSGYKFSSGIPDMFFVAEYFTPQKGFSGVIVAWENYYGATHYSVYKRAKLTATADWKRILVLDSTTLQKETAQFLPYVNSRLKIPMKPEQGYCIMDSDVRFDNIYEYKVVAGFFPSSENFKYDVILNSKALTRNVAPLPTDTIDTVAQSAMGSPDYAWILALCNRDIQFFSPAAATQQIRSVLGIGSYVIVPNDLNDIAKLFVESAYYFGLEKTVSNVLSELNPIANSQFFKAVSESFDEPSSTFSFRSLNTRLATAYPAYGKILSNASNNVGTSGVTLFNYADIVGFDSLAKLNLFILQLRTIFINVFYAARSQ